MFLMFRKIQAKSNLVTEFWKNGKPLRTETVVLFKVKIEHIF